MCVDTWTGMAGCTVDVDVAADGAAVSGWIAHTPPGGGQTIDPCTFPVRLQVRAGEEYQVNVDVVDTGGGGTATVRRTRRCGADVLTPPDCVLAGGQSHVLLAAGF